MLPLWVWLGRKSWKGVETIEKRYPSVESGICVFVCARKKNNSFEISVISFKACKNCKSPVQKGF